MSNILQFPTGDPVPEKTAPEPYTPGAILQIDESQWRVEKVVPATEQNPDGYLLQGIAPGATSERPLTYAFFVPAVLLHSIKKP